MPDLGTEAVVPRPGVCVCQLLEPQATLCCFVTRFNYRSTIKLVSEGAYEFW